MTQDIALFRAMGAKMSYDTQRQKVLSQNVANADSPGYRANDLKTADFSSMLGNLAGKTAKLQPVATNPMHLSGINAAVTPKTQGQKTSYEISPSGNGVDIEEQMVKEGQTTTDYSLVTSLYEKQMSMLHTALGQ